MFSAGNGSNSIAENTLRVRISDTQSAITKPDLSLGTRAVMTERKATQAYPPRPRQTKGDRSTGGSAVRPGPHTRLPCP